MAGNLGIFHTENNADGGKGGQTVAGSEGETKKKERKDQKGQTHDSKMMCEGGVKGLGGGRRGSPNHFIAVELIRSNQRENHLLRDQINHS